MTKWIALAYAAMSVCIATIVGISLFTIHETNNITIIVNTGTVTIGIVGAIFLFFWGLDKL